MAENGGVYVIFCPALPLRVLLRLKRSRASSHMTTSLGTTPRADLLHSTPVTGDEMSRDEEPARSTAALPWLPLGRARVGSVSQPPCSCQRVCECVCAG